MQPLVFDPKNMPIVQGTSRYPRAPRMMIVFAGIIMLACLWITVDLSRVDRYIIARIGTDTQATISDKFRTGGRSRTPKVVYSYSADNQQRSVTEEVLEESFAKINIDDQVTIKTIAFYPYAALYPGDVSLLGVLIGCTVGLMMLSTIWLMTRHFVKKMNRFHDHGQIVQGRILAINEINQSNIKFTYELRTPPSQVLRNTATVDTNQVKLPIEHLVGQPIAVIYVDDQTYQVL